MGLDIGTAPKNGSRIRVSDGLVETEAWFEANLNDFICMDEEWNLILLGKVTVLKTWRPLDTNLLPSPTASKKEGDKP